MAVSKFLPYAKFLLYLHLIFAHHSRTESRLTLSPRGVVSVCPGAQLAVTCSTDRSFLNWSITISPSASDSRAVTRSRLVSSSTQTGGLLVVEMKAFSISIMSTVDLFSSVLSYTNATADLYGTVIKCSHLGYSSAESDSSMVIVHITTADLVNFHPLRVVTKISNLAFGVDDITITLSWPQQDSNVSYDVSIVPQVTFVEGLINQGSLNVTVTVAYNTPYVVSIVARLCGHNISRNSTTLNYVKCDNVLHLLGPEDGSIQVNGYSDPAFVGTNVTLECSLLNHVLTGPNATTCMGNGRWQPDPREVRCEADCGVPLVDSSLNLTYNSTLEGSVALVQCDGFVVTALCHRNGSWSPRLTDSVCNFTSIMMSSDPDVGNSPPVSVNIIILIGVVVLVVLLLVGVMVPIAAVVIKKRSHIHQKKRLLKVGETHANDHQTKESQSEYSLLQHPVSLSQKKPQKHASSRDVGNPHINNLSPKISDGNMGDVLSSQPTQPIYETLMGCATVDLEMSENVAYVPIHSIKK